MAGAQSAWGLDMGVSSLKAMKLSKEGDRVRVEEFEVIEHEKFLTEPDVDKDSLIRATLQKFITKHNIKRERIFIGVAGSTAFSRFVKLPPVEKKKIPEIVRFEAIQQIPFPLDQVNWDYQTFESPDSPEVEVGIFAMKKELVAAVMSNYQALGMTVEGVQMSPLAIYNAAMYDGMTGGKGTIVIDMGAEHTDLIIIEGGRVWLRTINIGGNHFTDALAKSFKRSFQQGETLKKTAATSKYQKQIYQSMRPVFADLTSQIQQSIGFYSQSHRDSRLERILGMGNPFRLPNLQKYLQQELKMDVGRLENFAQASSEKAAALNETILSMTTAYGLALQGLGLAAIDTNLLPVEIARKMLWRTKRPWFVGATSLVVLGALGLVAQWYMQDSAFAAQASVAEKNNEALGQAKRLVGEYDKIPKTYNNDVDKENSQLALAAERSVWPYIVTDIYAGVNALGRNGSVVITSVNSEYKGSLAAYHASVQNNGAAPAPGGAPAGALAAAAATAPSTQPGSSDHGYVITIMGYAPSGGYQMAQRFRDAIVKLAPRNKEEDYKKPYYFTSQPYSGWTYPSRGGGGPGMMGGGSTSTVTAPWGSVKGPYWEAFVPDFLGIKPPAARPGFMGGGDMGNPTQDIGPVDMFSSSARGSKYMDGDYMFTILLDANIVHLKQQK